MTDPTTEREAVARAIDMTPMSDGDPLGVALAENFRIDDVCETAADVRRSLDDLLLKAADAALAASAKWRAEDRKAWREDNASAIDAAPKAPKRRLKAL